jgi:hypothetical protein
MPTLVEFAELARYDASPSSDNAGEQLVALAYAYLEQHPELSYTAAFAAVQREHPELAEAYLHQTRG